MPLNYARGCQELERLIPSILITRLLLLQVEITKLQLPEYIYSSHILCISLRTIIYLSDIDMIIFIIL